MAAHLYKVTEWECSGKWHCNDVNNFTGDGCQWYTPARLLGISLEDYILKLVNEFGCDNIHYSAEKNVLIFCWSEYSKCHKYVLWINRMARNGNWIVS